MACIVCSFSGKNAFDIFPFVHEQQYLVIFVICNPGWHLGEQGSEGKTGSRRRSLAKAAILISPKDLLFKRGSANGDYGWS